MACEGSKSGGDCCGVLEHHNVATTGVTVVLLNRQEAAGCCQSRSDEESEGDESGEGHWCCEVYRGAFVRNATNCSSASLWHL